MWVTKLFVVLFSLGVSISFFLLDLFFLYFSSDLIIHLLHIWLHIWLLHLLFSWYIDTFLDRKNLNYFLKIICIYNNFLAKWLPCQLCFIQFIFLIFNREGCASKLWKLFEQKKNLTCSCIFLHLNYLF